MTVICHLDLLSILQSPNDNPHAWIAAQRRLLYHSCTYKGDRTVYRVRSLKTLNSHVAPETPGSIHEGGELGYAAFHAYGAAFDNPDLIVACVVGDGEAETGSAVEQGSSSPSQEGAEGAASGT